MRAVLPDRSKIVVLMKVSQGLVLFEWDGDNTGFAPASHGIRGQTANQTARIGSFAPGGAGRCDFMPARGMKGTAMHTAQTKVALVTGAGRGIGQAIALSLARSGFAIVVNDLPGSPGLAETVAAIEAEGAQAAAAPGDISDLGGHPALVAAAWSAFGRIDCLVNNAGVSVSRRGDVLDVEPESFDRLIAINLRGPFFLTQAVARRMVANPAPGFRSIVTISSLNAEAASPDRAEYCISKIGLAMMSRVFALRLAAEDIHCYEVRPGVIRTQMTAVARDKI
jgi:3-oxoacyl-[acyl-carrier protein] reductase